MFPPKALFLRFDPQLLASLCHGAPSRSSWPMAHCSLTFPKAAAREADVLLRIGSGSNATVVEVPPSDVVDPAPMSVNVTPVSANFNPALVVSSPPLKQPDPAPTPDNVDCESLLDACSSAPLWTSDGRLRCLLTGGGSRETKGPAGWPGARVEVGVR